MENEPFQDDMLREQVAQIAVAILANEGRIASERDIRKELGGGDLARISSHQRAWVKRAIQVFRQASNDFSLMSDNEGLSEALLHTKLVREEAIESAQLAAQVFWDDLEELKDEIRKVKDEGAQLVRRMRQLLEEVPDLEKTFAALRRDQVALSELLQHAALGRADSSWVQSRAEAVSEASEQQKTLQDILSYLQNERSRVAAEWKDVRQLMELVHAGHKTLRGRLSKVFEVDGNVPNGDGSLVEKRSDAGDS